MRTRRIRSSHPGQEEGVRPALPPLVSESGIDRQFIATMIVSATLVAATAVAYRAVRQLRLKEPAPITVPRGDADRISGMLNEGVYAREAAR